MKEGPGKSPLRRILDKSGTNPVEINVNEALNQFLSPSHDKGLLNRSLPILPLVELLPCTDSDQLIDLGMTSLSLLSDRQMDAIGGNRVIEHTRLEYKPLSGTAAG